MQSKPMSATRAQTLLNQRAKLLTDVSKSLNGDPPMNWKAGDRAAYTAQLRALGFQLMGGPPLSDLLTSVNSFAR